MPETPEQLEFKQAIRREALRLGFARCGFTTADPLAHEPELERWIEAGMAASMDYMQRSWQQRAHPQQLLAGAASAIVVLMTTRNDNQAPPEAGHGRIARYARGRDYHRVFRERLERLSDWIGQRCDGPTPGARVVVDTAPLLERELAMRAGLGFIGKNTMLITPGLGSHTLLGTLLTTVLLPPDDPQPPRCGRCELCLHACPTDAFVAARQLDARRCISYLTIEHRGQIPADLASRLDGWVFGCDACQEVCPYNAPTHHGPATEPDPEIAPDDGQGGLALAELLRLRSGNYRRLVRDRALSRVSRPNWQRNAAAVAAGRAEQDADLDLALRGAARADNETVRETAGWAIAQRLKSPKG